MEKVVRLGDVKIFQDFRFFVCLILVFSILFLPPIRLSLSFSVRVEDIIFLLVLPIFLFKERVILNRTTLLVFSLIIVEIISILVNNNILYVSALFEPVKILKFFIILNIFFRGFLKYQNRFMRYFDIFFIILVVINFFQYFNILDFNDYIGKFYIPEHHLTVFMEEPLATKRLLGLMGNPNNNAILFSFFYSFFTAIYILLKQKKYMYYSIGAIVMVVFCQSRTTFIALLFSILLLPLFVDIRRYLGKISKMFLILLVLLIVSFSLIQMSYLTSIKDISVFESSSWQVRILVWKYLWDYIKQQPLWGSGGYKELYYSQNIYVDSGYFWFLYNFGMVSVIIYILLFLNQIFTSLKHRRTSFSYLNFAFSVIILITSISNAPFQEPRLNLLIAISIALFSSHLKERSMTENKGEIG